ncbi:hypothetical protein IFM89_033368 [Coptis chinensis]|uniref:ABC transmembrane type-1 domain-containing protein n=1 Tax=Coptis chinensis TaxID=261450 RepID=A0A835HLE6_9MAGN|nr:hypothetical protein IFM89_033368 [Coptis chinensis]
MELYFQVLVYSSPVWSKHSMNPPSDLRKDSRFWPWSLIFVSVGIVSFLASSARAYCFGVAGCRLVKRIRSIMCFQLVVHMEVSSFDEPEHLSAVIGARLSADAANVCGVVGDALALLVQNAATTIACWQLAMIVLVMLPVVGFNGWVQMKFMKGFTADAKASQIANDAVGNMRTVSSLCAEEKVMQLYKRKCEGPRKTGIRQGLVFFSLFVAAIGISESSSYIPDSGTAKDSTASLFAILDRKSKIDSGDDSGMALGDIKGEIQFRSVNFKYPRRPDVQILIDICLVIDPYKVSYTIREGCTCNGQRAKKKLLSDEATSALDAESERVVQGALDRVMVSRTTIVGLSTIKNADLIAVIKNGIITEKGKHEELLNIENGVYANLAALHMRSSS